MGTVSIGGASFDVFGTYAEAQTYYKASLGSAADAWNAAASQVVKSQGLVTATRMILRAGPVDPSTGLAIDTSTTIVPVQEASYELAGALLADPTLLSSVVSGSNVRRSRSRDKVGDLETESEVEYFRSTLGLFGRFPAPVQLLLGPYLGGLGLAGITVTGTDAESEFLEVNPFGLLVPGFP